MMNYMQHFFANYQAELNKGAPSLSTSQISPENPNRMSQQTLQEEKPRQEE